MPNWPVHEGHVPVPGAQLYFRESGGGRPLVVVHGGPDFNHNYLLPERDGLAPASHADLLWFRARRRAGEAGSLAKMRAIAAADAV